MEKCHIAGIAYAILEHHLGKSEFGSLIGLIGRLSKSVIAFTYSKLLLLIKKGKS